MRLAAVEATGAPTRCLAHPDPRADGGKARPQHRHRHGGRKLLALRRNRMRCHRLKNAPEQAPIKGYREYRTAKGAHHHVLVKPIVGVYRFLDRKRIVAGLRRTVTMALPGTADAGRSPAAEMIRTG